MENNRIKLTGLWKKEGRDGSVFYSGKLSYNASLLLFRNQYKRSEKDPDLVLYIGKSEKKEKPQEDPDPDTEVPF
jgi:hypothetical protein